MGSLKGMEKGDWGGRKSRHDKATHYVTIPKQSLSLSTLFFLSFFPPLTVYSFSISSFSSFPGKQKRKSMDSTAWKLQTPKSEI